MKIGILTFHYSNNYGALLQTYALSKTLSKLGFEPMIINRVPLQNKPKSFLGRIKAAARQIIQEQFKKSFSRFRKDFLTNTTRIVNNERDLNDLTQQFDAVIVGSDQVWRIDYTKELRLNYFLDFVPDHIMKISYAASFGKDEFECKAETLVQVKKLLERFDAISVREESGVAICKDLFGINSIHLLDPTLLLTQFDYKKLITKNNRSNDRKFISIYILDEAKEKSKIIELIARKIGLKTLNIAKERHAIFSIIKLITNSRNYFYPSFSEWLKGIQNAEFIITDSFHGTVFAIIYNKPFITIGNSGRGLERFKSLLKMFGLEDRLILSLNDLTFEKIQKPINFAMVNQILKNEQQKSLAFINKSLNSKHADR